MTVIDPHQSWLALELRAAETENANHRALLTQVRDHMEYEIKGQIEPLMGTLISDPVYHFWNDNPFILKGYDQIRGFYDGMISAGSTQFQVVLDRIFVDDGGVITEGQVKQVYRGAAASAMGLVELDGRPVDAEELILTNTQLITVWPAGENNKLVGEDIYFGENPLKNASRISEEDLPDYYQL